MIIRSLSRKSASFRQLYHYINRDRTIPYSILWNLPSHDAFEEKRILETFYENAQLLKKGKKRNLLYHEIMSILVEPNVPLEAQMQALRDLALKYIQARGQNLLCYGRMHLEGQNLHIHLMISANELNQEKRFHLTSSEFEQVKVQCEQYLQQKYPELRQPVIFQKEQTRSPNKTRQREYEFTRRTGQKTQKQQVKERLQTLFQAERESSLESLLKREGFELYRRGKHHGVVYRGRKYRMGTLGLEEQFFDALRKPASRSKEESDYPQKPQAGETKERSAQSAAQPQDSGIDQLWRGVFVAEARERARLFVAFLKAREGEGWSGFSL